jgi:D-alanyl-lipoteichoic acid acyltransferase DltB (MBOAT superfamily)
MLRVDGIRLVMLGLWKKVVCADMLGRFVDGVYQSPALHAGADVLLAIYAYTFQIYFDFSGYSDIAIGLAAILGYRFPQNFNRPYAAPNVSEFWRRWHISLSTWLRDYLYVPLGGNRRGTLRTYVNLFVTMLLGGLWHGANYTFILWGAYQGGLLAIHRLLRERGWLEVLPTRGLSGRLVHAASVLLTFHPRGSRLRAIPGGIPDGVRHFAG